MTQDLLNATTAFTSALRAERRPWDAVYQEVADYMQPTRSSFTAPIAPGDTGMRNLFDDAGMWSAEQFASGLHSMNNSPLSRWFTIEAVNADDRYDSDMLEWQDTVTNWLYDQFNNPRSSFHSMIQETNLDLGLFGYGVGYSEWDDEDGAVRFQSFFAGECYLIEDAYGRVCGIMRCYEAKTSDLLSSYADKLTADAKNKLNGNPSGCWKMQHIILSKSHPMGKKWADAGRPDILPRHKCVSVRLCQDLQKEPLKLGGYISLPVHVSRWGKRTGHVYPNSPGQVALPSMRRINAAQKDLMLILHRMASPASQGPDDEFLSPYDLSPGAKNFYRPNSNDRIEIIQGQFGDPTYALQWLRETQEKVYRAFYVDAFLTTNDSNGQNVKAAFVHQRRDERFRQLAAMLTRVEREFNSSIIMHTYELGIEKGKIPAPPNGGKYSFQIKYQSPIARAQRGEVVDSILQTYEAMLPFAQVKPQVMEVWNEYEVAQFVGIDTHALPAKLFKSKEQYDVVLQQMAEQQQQEQMLAQSQVAKNYGAGIKDVSSAASEGFI